VTRTSDPSGNGCISMRASTHGERLARMRRGLARCGKPDGRMRTVAGVIASIERMAASTSARCGLLAARLRARLHEQP
jgi:hypothetical protein